MTNRRSFVLAGLGSLAAVLTSREARAGLFCRRRRSSGKDPRVVTIDADGIDCDTETPMVHIPKTLTGRAWLVTAHGRAHPVEFDDPAVAEEIVEVEIDDEICDVASLSVGANDSYTIIFSGSDMLDSADPHTANVTFKRWQFDASRSSGELDVSHSAREEE